MTTNGTSTAQPVRDGTNAASSAPFTPPSGKRIRPWMWTALSLLVVALLAVGFALRPKAAPPATTVPLVRKTLVATVTATGTVNPQDTISVGTQVSGTIQSIDADYNDRVRAGAVLARLDPTLFQAALAQARGTLDQAQQQWASAVAGASAGSSNRTAAYADADAALQNERVAGAALASADAGVAKAQATLDLARRTLERDRELLSSGYIAQSQYDADDANRVAAQSALDSAVVTARQARLQLAAARSQSTAGNAQGNAAAAQATGAQRVAAADLAAISAAQAQVRTAEINLDHTVIISPVDGTVIARNVSIGQTVAASFQTPTLYTIAKDLGRMEIDLAVGEPDVGGVRAGQPVSLTVLAYPDEVFHGTVSQVRENPTTIQNVVTYDTVVYVANPAGKLRPGMTANAAIQVAQAKDALVVPLDALRGRTASAAARTASSTWGNTGTGASANLRAGSVANLTIEDAHRQREVPVRVLLVTASDAAIQPLAGTLAAGTPVVTGSGP